MEAKGGDEVFNCVRFPKDEGCASAVQPSSYQYVGDGLFLVVALGGVAIAVTISVAVTIAIAVAAIFARDVLCSVEEDAQLVVLLLVVEFFYFLEDAAVHQTCSNHEDGHVGVLLDNAGVGNNLNGRTIKDDEVVLFAYEGNHLLEAVALQELGGVGRHNAYGQ